MGTSNMFPQCKNSQILLFLWGHLVPINIYKQAQTPSTHKTHTHTHIHSQYQIIWFQHLHHYDNNSCYNFISGLYAVMIISKFPCYKAYVSALIRDNYTAIYQTGQRQFLEFISCQYQIHFIIMTFLPGIAHFIIRADNKVIVINQRCGCVHVFVALCENKMSR